MSLPIEELGGLPESEINLRILQAKVDMGEMLDEKLGQVTSVVSIRMDKHEDAVNGRLDRQDESIAKVLEIVTRVDAKGDVWHTEDLTYRKSMESRVSAIEVILRYIKSWVFVSKTIAQVSKATLFVVKEGKHIMLIFTSVCAAYLTTMSAVHVLWPVYIHPFLLHHHIMSH